MNNNTEQKNPTEETYHIESGTYRVNNKIGLVYKWDDESKKFLLHRDFDPEKRLSLSEKLSARRLDQ